MNHIAYLDHAATSPMLPVVRDVLLDQFARTGNASSLHTAGRDARRHVEEARETLAAALGARPSEVIFTAGGTEADNLAIKGIYWARNADRPRPRVLISAVEHHAVLDPAYWLAQAEGAEVIEIPVDSSGAVKLSALEQLLQADPDGTALVAVMWANNEVGTIQPIAQIAELAHRHGVPVHSDAVQAVGQIPVSLAESGVDSLALTGHKLGGPPGVGALLARRDLKLTPVLHGGGQERGVRSGTLDVAGSCALAAAVAHVVANQSETATRLARLRDNLVSGVQNLTDAVVRGGTGENRLPANAHFTFPGCEGDSLLYLLDSHGVQVSTGSACRAGVPQPSHVLLAMGVSEYDARGALRFSLGSTSTQRDIDALLAVLPQVVARARNAGLASGAGLASNAG